MNKSNALLANLVLGISAAGLLAACGGGTDSTTSTSQSAKLLASASLPPGKNFNLSAYTLQTLDSSLNVKQVNLSSNSTYTDAYFFTDTSGGIKFQVPSGAGSTANSEYPRSELRNNNDWNLSSSGGTHSLTATLKVVAQPATGQIIVGQIHGEKTGGSEALKIRWTNGNIVAGYKVNFADSEVKTTLISGVPLGTSFTYSIKVVGLKATVTATSGSKTGTKTITYGSSSWSGIGMYFKAGNYSQDGSKDGSHSSVVFSALN